jgi:hypothetical protein
MTTQPMGAVAVAPAWGGALVKTGYDYLVLDIETANPPSEEVDRWFEKTYKPPSNVKDPAKLKERRQTAYESAHAKAAVLPIAPIIAIGLKSETELRCFHWMWEHEPMQRMNATVQGVADQKAMLGLLVALFAEKVSADTVLAGFNTEEFDFPRIRQALARQKMPMPDALHPMNREQTLFDNMKKFCRLYSGERDIMANCPEVSVALGIEPHKVSGAIVPQLYEAKEYEAVVDKVLLDVLEEEQQFLRMTGQAR